MVRANRLHTGIALALAGCFLYFVTPTLVGLCERALLALAPSAERASNFATLHLDASKGYFYDIDQAEYLYRKAATFDSSYPYVYHQLARIAFLRGDLVRALALINLEVQNHGDTQPNTYYVRGLIRGYAGDYGGAAKDYEIFLERSPDNWAGITDYSWVLLKAERFKEAAEATESGLTMFPDNAWLLNTNAIALYELGEYELALERARRAVTAADKLTKREWLMAYPGNDPRVANEGLATLRKSARDNMHSIETTLTENAVQ